MKTWENLPSSDVGCSDMKSKRPDLVKQVKVNLLLKHVTKIITKLSMCHIIK